MKHPGSKKITGARLWTTLPHCDPHNMSWDSSVGIATGYGLDGRGVRVRVPVKARFYLLHFIQTGSVTQSASCPGGGSFLMGKAAEA
jgi:hypothetical protein